MESSKFKTILAVGTVMLGAFVVLGLLWFFFLSAGAPVGLGWYLFSFAAGLSMIVLPCTLPLAFVIVPLSLGKGVKGFGIAISFGLGVAIMLSMYGVFAALLGEVAIGSLGAPLEVVKNWLYFIAGTFAFLFALGEIGLVKFRMPSYTGAAPAFIQKRSDYFKALLLGLFLGNVGVGCPHPATPVILTRIAASGDVFYGWLLFFVHAVGRVLPLLLLAFLAMLGVNALQWLLARKDKIERATGWGMVFVAGFILVLGLFSHDWWVYSGQHTLFEDLTGEEHFLGLIIQRFNLVGVPHVHGIPTGSGLFGLPLWLGNWVLVGLWMVPLWWYYFKIKKDVKAMPEEEKKTETKALTMRFWFTTVFSLLLISTFVWVLPDSFLYHKSHSMDHDEVAEMEDHHMDEMGGHDGHGAIAFHEASEVVSGLAVSAVVRPDVLAAGATTSMEFFVHERPSNAPISVSQLEIEHEKVMHVVGVRNDLNEFFHIHPAPSTSQGVLSVEHIFAKPGTYKMWAEIKKDGVNHVFGEPEMAVSGEGEKSNKEVIFNSSAIVGGYQVLLDFEPPIVKGEETEISFDIHDSVGKEVEVENYLGAQMHLSVIKDDLKEFIHTHPEDGNHSHAFQSKGLAAAVLAHSGPTENVEMGSMMQDEHISFHVVFPEEGIYRMFAQFRPKGISLPADEALTVAFYVKVEAKRPSVLSPWWMMLLVSSVLIVALSLVVRRFLKVETQN